VMCFDGGRPWHFRAAQELEDRGGRGSFFLDSTALMRHLSQWRDLYARGHLIGAFPLHDLTGSDGVRPTLDPSLLERETELLFEAFDHAQIHSPMLVTQRKPECIVFDDEENEFWQALASLPNGVRFVTAREL
jgi:hypothetical protein